MEDPMKIEPVSKDWLYTTMCISGLTVAEMNDILTRGEDALGEVMALHGAEGAFTCWKCGYGIYSIRHCGGDLFVQIGNSCD